MVQLSTVGKVISGGPATVGMGLDDHENLMSKPPGHAGGPSGGSSLGNYKGVMLCSRPAAPVGIDAAGGATAVK